MLNDLHSFEKRMYGIMHMLIKQHDYELVPVYFISVTFKQYLLFTNFSLCFFMFSLL